MAVEVETLLVKLEARITDFEKKMARAEKQAATSAKKIQGTFDKLPGAINKSFAALGVGLSVGAFVKIIKDGIAAGEAIGDMADKLGIGTEALQEFTHVAEQSGAGVEDISAGFRGMTKFLGQASVGTKTATNLLSQLGLSFDELKNKNPADVFETLLDRIGAISNPLQRNATLVAVFGKAGVQLSQVAQLGAKGIEQLRNEAQKLGLVMSDQTVRSLQSAGDQLDKLNRLWVVAEGKIAAVFLPALRDLVTFLTSSEFQAALNELVGAISREVTQDIKDFLALLGVAKRVWAEIKSLPGGNLSATDQPSPMGPGVNSDAADAAIVNRGKLMGRIADATDGASTATKTLSAATIEGSESFKKAQAAALGLGKSTEDLADDYAPLGGVTNEAAAAAKKHADELKAEQDALTFAGEQIGRTARDQAIFNAVNKAGVDISSAAGKSIADQAAANFDLQESYARLVERMDTFREAAKSGLGSFVSGLREGKSVLDSLGDALDSITDRLTDFILNGAIDALLGKPGESGGVLSSFIGRRSGGSVSANRPVKVGEDGEEIFVPRTSGVIGRAAGGGGVKIETHYHNNAGVRVQEKQSRTDSGVRLDVMIDDIVAGKGQDPSSKISRMLTGRGAVASPIRR